MNTGPKGISPEKIWHSHPAIDPASAYIIFRKGNSWKFRERIKGK